MDNYELAELALYAALVLMTVCIAAFFAAKTCLAVAEVRSLHEHTQYDWAIHRNHILNAEDTSGMSVTASTARYYNMEDAD
jgi:hypothetical protein